MQKVKIVLGLILFITAVDAGRSVRTPFVESPDDCFDASSYCVNNVFLCNSSSLVKEKCRKTCGFCAENPDISTTPEPCGGFQCFNGDCINNNSQCDGIKDCSDNSDESNCNDCFDTSSYCINNIFLCNSSSLVKEKCRKTCGFCTENPDIPTTPEPCGGFQCFNGDCINNNSQCDGIKDCSDNSDEIESNCNPTTPEPCGGFQCFNRECINEIYQCDGINDCSDNSDEINCIVVQPFGILSHWTTSVTACIIDHNNRIAQLVPNLENCKDECLRQNRRVTGRPIPEFICRSIEYNSFTQQCSLSEESRYTTKHFEEPCSIPGWIYTERFLPQGATQRPRPKHGLNNYRSGS